MVFFWFRRDLRVEDNHALYRALTSGHSVLPIFIFDRNILDDLASSKDARVEFIHREVLRLKNIFREKGSDLLIRYGNPVEEWQSILQEYGETEIYANRDYEPYAKQRDERIRELITEQGGELHLLKDQVIFHGDEVQKNDGGPYTVFTPYKRKWYEMLEERGGKEDLTNSVAFQSFPSEDHLQALHKISNLSSIQLEEMGFEASGIDIPSKTISQGKIRQYDKKRNFPSADGTSRLGIHFRFGTISIRDKARKALQLNRTYLNELIWRDFYSQILDHFPQVVKEPFREKYSLLEWRNNEDEFRRWCNGTTGYPIVDAGMRELNATGYMHNRVRMITASFLTKHLLIDWRWGEAYFAEKLLDYELASNNGGWQWAAGTGNDAAPYFRIFNPYTQVEKFDKDHQYIDRWVPERKSSKYPDPIVDHKMARERCLKTYKAALEEYDRQHS